MTSTGTLKNYTGLTLSIMIFNNDLLRYCHLRGIYSTNVLNVPALGEVWQNGFSHLAWLNRSGGYEIRNANFKGCKGVKDITILGGSPSNICYVIEGFFDCLTLFEMYNVWYCERHGLKPVEFPNVIVLNSTTQTKKAVEFLNTRTFINKIYFIVDNDQAGKQAYYDMSSFLQHGKCEALQVPYCKDLNEFWTCEKREVRMRVDSVIDFLFNR